MNLRDRERNEPHATLDVALLNEGCLLAAVTCETAGIQASLTVVSEQKVLTCRNVVGHHRAVAAAGRMTERVPQITRVQVLRFLQLVSLVVTGGFDEHESVLDGHGIAGHADDAFYVVLLPVIGRAEHHNVPARGFPKKVRELIDDDVLLVVERIDHRTALHLERRDEECADGRHDRNDHDDIEENVEEVIPESVLLELHPGHSTERLERCTALCPKRYTEGHAR